MSDLRFIIKCCRDGDAKQQKVLYERYYGYAFRVALTYIFQHEEARFVVNDSFLKLFRSVNRFVPAGNDDVERQLLGWLRRIVINTAIDQLRRSNKQSEKISRHPEEICDADHALLYKELIQQVTTLPQSYREVFHMHVINGFKHNEIADLLGISIGTSKSNLSKAKSYLRRRIKAEAGFSLS